MIEARCTTIHLKDLSGIREKKKLQKRKGSIIAPAYKKGLKQICITFTILCVYCDMLSTIGVITVFILIY
jgi:hypothetical protein